MGVPKRKTSKSKQRIRKAAQKIGSPALTKCAQCHHLKPPHTVCPNCGYYKKRKVMEVT